MVTSNIINDHPMLHVYLTQDCRITHTLEELRRLALTMYDRDVVIDLTCIRDLDEDQLIILLTIEVLLHEAGHKLVLRGIPDPVKKTLDTLGLTNVLHLQESCA